MNNFAQKGKHVQRGASEISGSQHSKPAQNSSGRQKSNRVQGQNKPKESTAPLAGVGKPTEQKCRKCGGPWDKAHWKDCKGVKESNNVDQSSDEADSEISHGKLSACVETQVKDAAAIIIGGENVSIPPIDLKPICEPPLPGRCCDIGQAAKIPVRICDTQQLLTLDTGAGGSCIPLKILQRIDPKYTDNLI